MVFTFSTLLIVCIYANNVRFRGVISLEVFRQLRSRLSCPGTYTLGVLDVRRTPCETEHDVTFSSACDLGKITK